MSLSNIEIEELTKENLLNCINKCINQYGYEDIGMYNVIYNIGIDSLDFMELNLILSQKFKELDNKVFYKLDMSKCKPIDIYNIAKGIK